MPTNVVLFERLMYAALCLGLLILIIDGPRLMASPDIQAAGGPAFFVIVAFAGLALLLLFMWLIVRKKKDWARYLFAAMFVIGLWPSLQNVGVMLEEAPLAGVLSVAQHIIQAAALYFIFTGDAQQWFAKPVAT